MKSILKSLSLLSLMALLLSSCTDYGKKLKAEGTKGEVYYKGEGVTESDAKKLSDYLKEVKYFDETEKSVQLVKAKDGGFDVRFVIDEKKLKETKGAEEGFVAMGALISKNVFGNQAVNICLADDHMKDIKVLPFDRKKADALMAADEPKTNTGDDTGVATGSLDDYDKQIESGITFYWKAPITDQEAETIGKAVIATGDFGGGTPESTNIFIEKEGDKYLVKFPVADAYLNDASTLTSLEAIGRKLKNAAFANVPFSFVMMDVKRNSVQSWDY